MKRTPTRGQVRDIVNHKLTELGYRAHTLSNKQACIALGLTKQTTFARTLRAWAAGSIESNPDKIGEYRPASKKKKTRVIGKPPPRYINPNTDAFLESYEWRRVRMEALKLHGARCQCCGATPSDGLRVHVDHIKPRRLFPNLALDLTNLQVLCEVCNHGKGNWDATDWRSPVDGDADTWLAHMREIARKE